MSTWTEITALLEQAGLTVYSGYAPEQASLPFLVQRPIILSSQDIAINGAALDYDYQTGIYAAAESIEASFNLAVIVMATLQGAYVSGTTLNTSMGYTGAVTEGRYESMVTVQLNQGAL